MYGLSDHSNGMPATRLSALRHGSSRYSTPHAVDIDRTYVRISAPMTSPADAAAAARPGARPLLPAPRRAAGRSSTPGSALPGRRGALWRRRRLDGAIVRVVVTHIHPDHVGGPAARTTGAPVCQGALDYEQCERVWGNADWPERIADWFVLARRARARSPTSDRAGRRLRAVHPLRAATRSSLREGDEVDGWQVLELPGHADGHIACCATACSSPATTCSPRSARRSASTRTRAPTRSATTSPRSSARSSSRPRVALPGHGEPIEDPAARAQELVEHHLERLDAPRAAARPDAAHRVRGLARSLRAELAPAQRRFAVAETLSHLERLVREGGGAGRGGRRRALAAPFDRRRGYTRSQRWTSHPPSPRAPESGA